MSYALPFLLIGILLGVVCGWLAQAYVQQRRTLAAPRGEAAREPGMVPELEPALAPALAPITQAVDALGVHLRELETQRTATLSSLMSQVQAVSRTSSRLSERTDKLVTALRSPNVRGRWGEMQLERVVELGGMVKHVDFSPQEARTHDGTRVRPDLVIHLAGGRSIIVDAKVPFSSYLDALETQDPEEHAAYLRRHAHLLRSHVTALSAKDYRAAFDPTPEFVVLFVPADPFLDAALSVDTELLDYALGRDVVIATPTTLFALLRTVALTWQHDDYSATAREIHRLGRELYERLGTVSEHLNVVGRSLNKAVEAYNSTAGSLDARLLVTARKLKGMEVPRHVHGDAPELRRVDIRARDMTR